MLNPNLTFNELLKNLKKDAGTYFPVRVALLANFASQHLAKALKAAAAEQKISLQVWEGEYDSIETNIYDTSSPIYTDTYDFILIFQSTQKLYKEFSFDTAKDTFAERKIINTSVLVSLLQERTKSKIILSNYTELDDSTYGNFANKTEKSFLYQVRSLNYELMNLAIHKKNLFIVDVQQLFCQKGRAASFDPKLYVHADIIYDLDFMALLAQSTVQIILALTGSFKKCIILDLDNTLWGGVVGDDGLENIQLGDLGLGKAYTSLQLWLKNLKERGILLAVSSKNNEAIAKEVFLKHPGMILRLDDISVFAANWETKVDNIRFIQSILNIGFDAMVFIDDNPFERAIVKQHIPDITVPDLPDDPAAYVTYLQSLNLFETASLSIADAGRTKQYQEEASRAVLQKTFASEDEFLKSLEMQASVKPIDAFTLPRVAQLSQRSNQFNLRTKRYTEEDISQLLNDPSCYTLTISLKDTFGDYGLISAVILKKQPHNSLFIDTWIMSCRVLKRGVENLVLNEIVALAKEYGFQTIEGEYIPTAKNALVKDHYLNLGFTQAGTTNKWILDIDKHTPKPNFITKEETYVIN